MYNTEFLCTYKQMDDGDDQEDMYRIQFLQAFGIEQWDDDIINDITNHLFKKLSTLEEMQTIISKCREFKDHTMFITMLGDDDLTVFKLLFKFELFDITHKCITEYTNEGKITSNTLTSMINNL